MTMPLQAGLATAGRLNGAAIGTKALASATHTDRTTSFSGAMARPASTREIWTSENAVAVTTLTPQWSSFVRLTGLFKKSRKPV